MICHRGILEWIWALKQTFTANNICTTNLVDSILTKHTCSYPKLFFRLSCDFFIHFLLLIRRFRCIKLLIFTSSFLILLFHLLLRLLLLRLNFRLFLLFWLLFRWNDLRFNRFLLFLDNRINDHCNWRRLRFCHQRSFLDWNRVLLFTDRLFLGSSRFR